MTKIWEGMVNGGNSERKHKREGRRMVMGKENGMQQIGGRTGRRMAMANENGNGEGEQRW